MTIMEMTKKDFEKVPQKRDYREIIPEIYSLVIIPMKELHDSRYRCMDFVAVNIKQEPICRLSGVSDVLHLEGLDGRGFYHNEMPFKITPKGWALDCLPCGYIRVFTKKYPLKIENDIPLSDYCVYAAVTEDDC